MFSKCQCESDVKSLFRKLALRLHPDHGGSDELTILLNEAYSKAMKRVKLFEPIKSPTYEQKAYGGPDIKKGDEKISILDKMGTYLFLNKGKNRQYYDMVVAFYYKNGYIRHEFYMNLHALAKQYRIVGYD